MSKPRLKVVNDVTRLPEKQDSDPRLVTIAVAVIAGGFTYFLATNARARGTLWNAACGAIPGLEQIGSMFGSPINVDAAASEGENNEQ
jgi:hypothetical protein